MLSVLKSIEHEFKESFISESGNKISYGELFSHSSRLASGLKSIGLKNSTKCAVILDSGINWLKLDFALQLIQAVSVPIFATSSLENIKILLEDCKPEYLFCQNEDLSQKIQNVYSGFKEVFCPKSEGRTKSFEDISSLAYENEVFDLNYLSSNNLMTIIYTSGTSSKPKGVMLSYKNFASQINQISQAFYDITSKDLALSFLPLGHVFQRTITYFYITRGVQITFLSDPSSVAFALEEVKPNLITVVPRILDKIVDGIKDKINLLPNLLTRKAVLYIFHKLRNNIYAKNSIMIKIGKILFFNKLHAKLGSNIRYIVSGGAKLSSQTETFFENANLPLFQGYGMTECSPVISSNSKIAKKLGTVGKPLSSFEVKLSQDGELMVKGDSVMLGYLNSQDEKESCDRGINQDGFFCTGDIAEIDADGFLTIKARKSDICKTSYGKYINPVSIESQINAISYVENSCLISENRPYVTALIFVKQENRVKLEEIISDAMHKINDHMDKHQKVHYYTIIEQELSPQNGLMTQSLKIIRRKICEKFANEIDEMYK